MLTGVVTRFIRHRMHGSIVAGGENYFFHANYMERGQALPEEGDMVAFHPEELPKFDPKKRNIAKNVRIVTRATR